MRHASRLVLALGVACLVATASPRPVHSTHLKIIVGVTDDTAKWMVRQDGIVGVKTGATFAAGACLVFAADVSADQQPARIFGVVMGVPTLDDAFTEARSLIEAVSPALHYRNVLSTLQSLAEYQAPWGDNAFVFPQRDINLVVYDGMSLHLRVNVRPLRAPVLSGTDVGTLTVQVGDNTLRTPLYTTYSIDEPGLFWRITRTRLFS